METKEKAPALQERYERYITDEENSMSNRDFAIRADGAIVIFDPWGYFLILATGPGKEPEEGRQVDVVYKLALNGIEDAVDAIIPPIEVAGIIDDFANLLEVKE